MCSLASVWKYPHHLIIKGHLSILSSLSLGTMPDTCHFCYAQELLLPSACLGAQSWNTARISFFMEAADQGGQNGIHMSHFRWAHRMACGKTTLEVHIRLLLMTKETPSYAPLALPGVGRIVALCSFSQGLSMYLQG